MRKYLLLLLSNEVLKRIVIENINEYAKYTNPDLNELTSELYQKKQVFRLIIEPTDTSEKVMPTLSKEFKFDFTNKYLVNLNTWQYIKLDPINVYYELPLLCTIGNGKGEGDYFGINQEMVGAWANQRLQIVDDLTTYQKIKEVDSHFYEI